MKTRFDISINEQFAQRWLVDISTLTRELTFSLELVIQILLFSQTSDNLSMTNEGGLWNWNSSYITGC